MMTADEIRALAPAVRRRLEGFRDCFKRSQVFDYLISYTLGVMAAFDRKCIEPIALWVGEAVRRLQQFLSTFAWDHGKIESRLRRDIIDEFRCEHAIGVIDGSAHAKQGAKTPGVQRQWCGSRSAEAMACGVTRFDSVNSASQAVCHCLPGTGWENRQLRRRPAFDLHEQRREESVLGVHRFGPLVLVNK